MVNCLPVDRLKAFRVGDDRLENLFSDALQGSEAYHDLKPVLKLLLVLSHGQATVQRGFSTNKEVEVENLKSRSLIAQRIIIEHVTRVGGVREVAISKELLHSCQLARQRYMQCLDDEKKKRLTAEEQTKRKRTLDQLDELKVKKARLSTSITHLQNTEQSLCDKAETTRKVRFVVEANAMRRDRQKKEAEVKSLDEEIGAVAKQLST